MSLPEVEAMLHRSRPDLPVEGVIEYLRREYLGAGTPYSPRDVAEAVAGGPYTNESALHALLLLAGEPFHVIEPRWRFFDGDNAQIELSQDQVDDAVRSGEFRHPTTGEVVEGYEYKIQLWYESGATLDEAMSSARAP